MLGTLRDAGYELESQPEQADVVVVNTCGFIESAKQESIDAIIEAARLKSASRCKAVIVTGCLSQRYAGELADEIPEVDAFIGVGKNSELPQVVAKALAGERIVDSCRSNEVWTANGKRVRSTPPWTAYLKIADGCDNRCSYCAIPEIRGPFRSRPPELILAEAERMADEGVLEVNLVGQDLTRYGEDLGGGWNLEQLLRQLTRIDGLFWIRLLYCYPTRITDGLIELVATDPKICKYMDIPLQHGDDKILTAMNRRGNRAEYLRTITRLRELCPDIALRTSFILGFPGEGRDEFENLLSFVREIEFDRIGAFTYSQEEGTPAANLPDQVDHAVAVRRYNRLMELASEISLKRNKMMLGREIDVLVESPDSGRCHRDAPEIDGIVKLTGKVNPGEIIKAKVIEAGEYDLTASVTCRVMCDG